ncbi:unnamed protein product [Ceratitis capitata]|uniref:(Mediterranean fruit fly) hypothetical protein n=1 Tax=Ceratitis capitata TaxID=7213 RepID=A0A811VA07_CERCA|nr:unnamed protein product [Ceratitis capitata]
MDFFSLKFLEPVGSVSPKISIGEDLKHVKGKQTQGLSLLCPAQAYPQPVFSMLQACSSKCALSQHTPDIILTSTNCTAHHFSEPVGSVAPKITFLERFKMMQIASGSSSAIFCPAQSYPVPVFRCVK